MGEFVGDRAVVLGGSMAGLFAAHVLADAYREVVIVDRDRLAGVDGMRKATPQCFHAHALLARGQRAVESLFPGITAEFAAAGIATGDVGRDLRWFVNGQRLRPVESGLVALPTPRIVLENRIRDKVLARPTVRFVEFCDVLGLAVDPTGERVVGARIQRQAEGSVEETLSADLVVDTTGRGSRLSVWLGLMGYPQPREQRMRIGLGYATRHYRMPVGYLGSDLGYIVVQTPSHPRGAVFARERMLPDGGERYTLSLNGYLDYRPPGDIEGFLAYTKALPVPDIHEAISGAEPLDDIRTYHFPATLWRHYERLPRFPAGLLAMGDSVASPNPVYAQGNSISAAEALILREHLSRGTEPQARKFFADISRVIVPAWDVNMAGDISHPGVEGRVGPKIKMAAAYLPRVQRAAVHDGEVNKSFLRVAGLIDPPQALMRPDKVMRVLRVLRRSRKAGAGEE